MRKKACFSALFLLLCHTLTFLSKWYIIGLLCEVGRVLF